MAIRIALAGNPNSGKTTLFNALTGSTQHVGNWPGVTVEKKEGKLKGYKGEVTIQDLPGIYSLSPYTMEEVIARNYLLADRPEVILNIVDASNIERNVYLTTQLMEMGTPVVIALNMMDVVEKTGDSIDTKKLGEALSCTVVETSAVRNKGVKEAAEAALSAVKMAKPVDVVHIFSTEVEQALQQIIAVISGKVEQKAERYFAVKFFERDEKVRTDVALPKADSEKIEAIIQSVEAAKDDDSESIITAERYDFIAGLMKKVLKKKKTGLSTSDKIDKVVTNRWLALPIFVAVMFAIYYIAISTIGGWMTDWVNDTLFGEILLPGAESWLVSIGAAKWIIGLVVEGIIGGVGAVLGFLPQMLVLFLLLAILEDCGYMARIAFIMDRVFRKFGLSGKSFIPILIGTGCSVPGIMASRTIENDKDRRMTVMTTSFMPCSAKLPIIALISGALFADAWWVAASAYFIGIAAIILSGIILKKTKLFAGDPAPFIMELPAYHLPRVGGVLRSMWERGWAFIKKAGTIILISAIITWFMGSFSWSFTMVESADDSILASIGNLLAPIFKPLGFGDWKASVATVEGLVAKENVLSSFGILYNVGVESENGMELWSTLQATYAPIAGYSFLIFNLLCTPCFAAIGAIRREMNSAKWTWAALGYQTALAYAVSLMIYQFGTIGTNGFGIGTAAAIIVLVGFLYLIFRPQRKDKAGKNYDSVYQG